MIQSSLFPDLVPEVDEIPAVKAPTTVPYDGTWVLLRSTGRTINDVPRWHRVRAHLSDTSTLALCGHHGSNVTTDLQPGAMLNACPDCLTARPV